MITFMEEYSPETAYVICTAKRKRIIETPHGEITIIHWKDFLNDLWDQALEF